MSKSKRVFLTIMGDEDFWGNGDGMIVKTKPKKKMEMEIEEDEEYFDAIDKGFDEMESEEKKLKKILEEDDVFLEVAKRNSEEIGEENDEEEEEEEDDGEEGKDSGALSIGSSRDGDFMKNRPEAELRALLEGPFEYVLGDDKFYETYETIRKILANSEVVQQLRRNSAAVPLTSDQRVQTKHAVVVSSYREPDRRLSRNSKYYYHHNVGPEIYSRKVFVGGLPACVTETEILMFFSRFGRLQVDWPSKHYAFKSDSNQSMSSSESQTTINHSNLMQQVQKPTSHLALASPPFGQINPFQNNNNNFPASPLHFHQQQQQMAPRELPPRELPPIESNSMIAGPGGEKRQKHLGYVFLLFEKERSVRDLVAECFEEEAGLFITLDDCTTLGSVRVQIRPWLLADAEFLMDFNVPINTKLVAFIGGVPRPLKAVELAHFFEQTYGHVVCVGIDIDNKFKYPRGSGRVAFSNYDAYVNAITDRYIVLDHEDIHKRVEIKPYFFHNQSCEECSGRYHRQHAPFFCPSLECFQYYCETCWHKMHAHPSRFHHMPVVKGV
ncbi:unnamed protein product [Caenorhabditis angaria]|uniref:RRM domain-containing protein n=1 Tax=Caenorhabditis angaria TaxID=860376 RepID=A0A9P1IB10_9PELO|nr:unnamed protein product [Caenorhabditis angaria]